MHHCLSAYAVLKSWSGIAHALSTGVLLCRVWCLAPHTAEPQLPAAAQPARRPAGGQLQLPGPHHAQPAQLRKAHAAAAAADPGELEGGLQWDVLLHGMACTCDAAVSMLTVTRVS
jgi:hypothetical protein